MEDLVERASGQRRRGRAAAILVAALVFGLLWAPPTVAGSATPLTTAQDSDQLTAQQLGLEVTGGFGGFVAQRGWVPVEVTLAPRRLFSGTLAVLGNTDSGEVAEVRQVEVPAGSVKVFRFVLPPVHQARVQLSVEGHRPVTKTIAMRNADGFLVGVLGGVPPEPPSVSAYATDRGATFVGVDPVWLERLTALDPLSVLVAPTTALTSLSDAARANLASNVVSGLQLVAVAAGEGPVDLGIPNLPTPAASASTVTVPAGTAGLPTETSALSLEPAPASWTLTPEALGAPSGPHPGLSAALIAAQNVGRGRVVVSGVALGEDGLGRESRFWGHLLQPTGRVGGTLNGNAAGTLSDLAIQGLRSDDSTLPPIGWFALFLVAYVLIVGPFNGLVLARLGRRELAWVTIPAITLVFAVGAWIASAGTSPSLGVSGRVAYWIDGVGTEVAAAAIRAPRADTHTLVFSGSGWEVASGTWNAPSRVDRSDGNATVKMNLEALQTAAAVGRRVIDAPPPIELTAEVVGGDIQVEVANRSGKVLRDVRLRAGTFRETFDDLPVGATETFTIATRGELPVLQEWHDAFAGLRDREGAVAAPRALEAMVRFGVLDGNPGVIWLTATVKDRMGLASIQADGEAATDNGTLLAVGVTPAATPGSTSPFEVQRELITTGFGDAWQPGPLALEGQTEAVLRFRLPQEGAVEQLVSSLDRGQLRNNGGFREDFTCLEDVVDAGDGGQSSREVCGPQVAIDQAAEHCPDEAAHCAVEGEVFVICRFDGPCDQQPLPFEIPAVLESAGLEVYDRVERVWLPVKDAFAPTDEGGLGGDPARLLSPLGEVFVRVSGEMFPFDFSGRGIGAGRSAA